MLGAIVGDIVGSVYEWHNIKTKDFPLFRDDCFFMDDAVMTCAVAEEVMNGGQRDDFIDAMKKYGRMYPAQDTAVDSVHGYSPMIMRRRTDFVDIQNKKECGGNRQWQRRFLRNRAAALGLSETAPQG